MSSQIKKDASEKEENLKNSISLERDYIKQKHKLRENEEKIKYLMKEIDLLEKRYESLVVSKQETEPIQIVPNSSTRKKEATAVALASDWHVEEKVDKNVVNEMNEYNPTVAVKRIQFFFSNLLRLVEKERYVSIIENLVLWLGGDLMTGYIHEELLESNYMSPTETVLFLKKYLISGIDFLLLHGNFKKIHIPTNFGNHGRTTEKLKVGTGYKNSYEFMLYCALEEHYQNKREKRVVFSNSKSEFNFFEVYDKTIRCTHGYTIRYNGGIGGITVPAMKFIAFQNQIKRADFDIWGHFHEYFTNPYFCQNGSLIGVSHYGRRFGRQTPVQAFFIIDKNRGITTKMPIFTN